MEDWAPNVRVFFKSMLDVEEEGVEDEEEEEEANDESVEEEKAALSTRVDHKEEPPMKEGKEFTTAVEQEPTKLLSPEPLEPPMLPDLPALGCRDLLTQLPPPDLILSMKAHGSSAAKLPPPRSPDPTTVEARTERAGMRTMGVSGKEADCATFSC